MTLSEQRFLEYCSEREYSVEIIPPEPNVRRTADFRVRAGDACVLVEVEELTANEEDKRLDADLKAGRITTAGGVVGSRVRGHIRDAAKQLKSHKQENLPSVLVLYDNICIDGERHAFPCTDLRTFHIDAAMYGFVQATLVLGDGGVVGSKPDRAGPNRTTTDREKRYLSAICVLYDTPKLCLLTYITTMLRFDCLPVFLLDRRMHT